MGMREKATDLDPAVDRENWSAVEEAAELLHEERVREAMVELRRVLQSNRRNPYAYHLLGVALFEAGELEPARDAYRACLAVAPRHLGARTGLCHVLRMLGDTRGAIREGLTALSQVPGDGDSLYAVGLAYHAQGDEVAAVKYLEAFLETAPEFEVAAETRALLTLLGRSEPAPDAD
jgi:Flp pilus assembly protein TadD